MMGDKRYRGIVKWFNDTKGYGFIRLQGQPDVFVHYSDIEMDGHRTLQEGQTVEFGIGVSERSSNGRNQALEVNIVSG